MVAIRCSKSVTGGDTVNERTGEAFEFDIRLTVVGDKLKPGQPAPDFALDHLAPGASNIRTVKLSDSRGQVRLLNVVNSMDTPVCQVETKCWEDKLSVCQGREAHEASAKHHGVRRGIAVLRVAAPTVIALEKHTR